MIKTIPALVTALRSSPTPKTLGLYRGNDWTKFVTEKYNSQFDIVKTREWSLNFYRWPIDVDKRIEWWRHYPHSIMAIHRHMLIDDILLPKWSVRNIDFEAPIITSDYEAQNFSLHLFGKAVMCEPETLSKTWTYADDAVPLPQA